MPKAAHISFRLHGGIGNTLAFDAAGFVNKAGYTVEIPPAASDVLWCGMRDNTRNVIRRAQEILAVDALDDPQAFMDFYEANLHARGTRSFYDGLHVKNNRVSNLGLFSGFGGVIRLRYIVRRSSLLVGAARRARELLPRS